MQLLRRHFDTIYIVVQVWIDGFATALGCAVGYWVYSTQVLPETATALSWADYQPLFVVVTGVTLVSFWALGLYRSQKSILNVEEYRAVFQAGIVAFMATSAMVFLLRTADEIPNESSLLRWIQLPLEALHLDSESYSRVLYVLAFMSIILFTLIERAVMFRFLSGLHARGVGNQQVAIFGTGQMARRLEQKLRLFPMLGYRFAGFLELSEAGAPEQVAGHPVIGSEDDLDRLRDQYSVTRVIIAKPEMDESDLVRLCKRLESYGVQYQVVPRLYHFFTKRFTIETLDQLPLITPAVDGRRPLYAFFKRLMDFLLSLIGIAICLIPMILIALLIKRESPGPIFFTQVRRGSQNRSFRMVKFRTMYADMCGDAITPQSSTDPRITPLGRILRRASLDELPQLWNVLRGEMSIVGPRPEQPFIVDEYDEFQMMRLDAKPGITGLWQVSEARRAPIHENLDYDLYYIENQSMFLDMTIFFMTLATVFQPRSTS